MNKTLFAPVAQTSHNTNAAPNNAMGFDNAIIVSLTQINCPCCGNQIQITAQPVAPPFPSNRVTINMDTV